MVTANYTIDFAHVASKTVVAQDVLIQMILRVARHYLGSDIQTKTLLKLFVDHNTILLNFNLIFPMCRYFNSAVNALGR